MECRCRERKNITVEKRERRAWSIKDGKVSFKNSLFHHYSVWCDGCENEILEDDARSQAIKKVKEFEKQEGK